MKPRAENQNIAQVPGVKKIIAVASTKGGVGKSSVTCNLAIALTKMGKKVAIVDADIYGPSVPHIMNSKKKPDTDGGMIIPNISYGIKLMSVGFLINESDAAVFRGPMTTKILHQLIRSVNWTYDKNEVDVMLIDMPPGTGDVYLSIAEKFPISGVVLVSTPEKLSVIDVRRSIDCFEKLNMKLLGVIQNMSYFRSGNDKIHLFGKDGAKQLSSKFNLNFLGEIPIELTLSSLNEQNKPLVEYNESCEASISIKEIGQKLLNLC